MKFSKEEIEAIAKAANEGEKRSVRARQAPAIRRMMKGLAEIDFRRGSATALTKLCDAGAAYGWQEWEASSASRLLSPLSQKAKHSLKNQLRRRLARLTRPCLELERQSFELALTALGLGPAGGKAKSNDQMFLRDKPGDRLFVIFKKFPVLAGLWSLLIAQWRENNTEILKRIAHDRGALSRVFFRGQPLGNILDLRCGLSDAHHGGRTVALLEFEAGSLIYKPRPGEGEWQWHSLVGWMNKHGFQPRLKAARVLRRARYCWMEYVAPALCENTAETRRFYERIGGMIAMAYLVRAVDCHRENIVASGEHPILVDADALWHVSAVTKTQDALSQLYRTGFFPNSDPRSLQSRSSALGGMSAAFQHKLEIARGFGKAWRCLLGNEANRNAFARRLGQIRSTNRRWIYQATANYDAIRKASIQPAVLRSRLERDLLIHRYCARDSVTSAVVRAEAEAIRQMDFPYFFRRTVERMPPDPGAIRRETLKALECALFSVRKR
jgi:lantibiotic modifying enzyme